MENTVLVLGAGVSQGYGYPSGEGLVDKLKERLRAENTPSSRDFLRDLGALNRDSIDTFLNERKTLAPKAKRMIGETMIDREDLQNTKEGVDRESGNLYRFLANTLPENDYSRLRIITFNYDRSLEFYFGDVFLPLEEQNDKLAHERAKKLKIVHVHGRMMPLPFEFGVADREQVPYGTFHKAPSFSDAETSLVTKQRTLREIAGDYAERNFKTVYENDAVNEEAVEFIQWADRVFFLGFAYHHLNMKVLGMNSLERTTSKKILGTSYGIKSIRQREILKNYPAIWKLYERTAVGFFETVASLTDSDLDLDGPYSS